MQNQIAKFAINDMDMEIMDQKRIDVQICTVTNVSMNRAYPNEDNHTPLIWNTQELKNKRRPMITWYRSKNNETIKSMGEILPIYHGK